MASDMASDVDMVTDMASYVASDMASDVHVASDMESDAVM